MRSKNKFYEHSEGYMVGVTSKGIEFYFDKEDFEKVSQYTWYLSNRGAIETHNHKNNYKLLKLHRLMKNIVNPKEIIDHINHNTLDNRKENLRVCDSRENSYNQTITRSNNTSGYKGVTWDKTLKKWIAYIHVNYKKLHIGCFENKEDAARAYNEKALFYFGEFAFLNSV